MANHPLRRRGVRLGRPFRIGALALIALLLAGCGGADNGAKVEASLRHYISGLQPEEGAFPIGVGPPRVRDNGCKDRHATTKSGQVHSFHSAYVVLPEGLTLWSCVVTFRNSLTLPVDVAVKGSEVVAVFPGASSGAARQSPPTVYQGGG
jgi:hypothetical protein